MNYLYHVLCSICIYAMLGTSLNLAAGYAGMLSLAHASFFGLGAYVTALMMMKLHVGFWPAVLCAMLVCSMASLIPSLPSVRLKGDYFVLVTLAFQLIVYSLILNWVALTNGPFGVSGISGPVILGWKPTDNLSWLVVIGSVGLVLIGLLWLVKNSPYGLVLRAIRDDEVAALSLGKHTLAFKISAFAVSAAVAAVPGALYASYVHFIDPTSFTLDESILILSVVIVGGIGSFWGPLWGSLLLVLLPEGLRFLHVPDAVAANLRQMAYGLLLILMMLYRPQGITGDYQLDKP